MFKKITAISVFVLVLSFASPLHAAERGKALPAVPMTDSERIEAIFQSQQEILTQLAEIKQELAVIKMRATR